MLRVVCDYPEVNGLEDWLLSIQRTVQEFRPSRVALDSLSALERVGTMKAFREFVIGFTSFRAIVTGCAAAAPATAAYRADAAPKSCASVISRRRDTQPMDSSNCCRGLRPKLASGALNMLLKKFQRARPCGEAGAFPLFQAPWERKLY